jgi:hypothetical protein
MRGVVFVAVAVAIAAVVAAQSAAHLVLVLGAHRVGTILDLDRSNGLPDIVSTVSLACAAAGAAAVAHRHPRRRTVAGVLAVVLAGLTVADSLHDGAHPATIHGKVVIGLICFTGALLVVLGRTATPRVQVTLAVAGCALVAAFLVTGLDRFSTFFQRDRGDPVDEYAVVTKEDLELLGWSLVALALWDIAAVVVERFPPTIDHRHAPATAGAESGKVRAARPAP